MPETAIPNITNVIEVEVRDDNIIQGFASQIPFDIRANDLCLGTGIPVGFTRIEERGFPRWSNNEGSIALAHVDMVEFALARCPSAGTADSGCLHRCCQ